MGRAEEGGPDSLENLDWLVDGHLKPVIGSCCVLCLHLPPGLSNAGLCNALARGGGGVGGHCLSVTGRDVIPFPPISRLQSAVLGMSRGSWSTFFDN